MGLREDRRVRRVAFVVSAALVGLLGAWLGALLLARTEVPMGPFRVEVNAGFGRGITDIGLPPFGRVLADTHVAPLRIEASLEDVGVERLTEVVGRMGIEGLAEQVERDALAELRRLAVRLLAVSVLGAVVLAALVFRRRWKAVLIAALAALLAVGAAELLAWRTYRPEAFAEPTYTGSLGPAAKLIGPVREATGRIEDFRAGLQALIAGATRAYTSIQAQPLAGRDVIRVLHLSDIHASVLGMDFAREVADAFDIDIVVDTGDMTSFATPVEDLIATEIPEFERPYLFVPGNHDPMSLEEQIAQTENATVLDGDVVAVDGIVVYGLGHPEFSPSGTEEGIDPAGFEASSRSAAPIVAADLAALDEPPDIVAVHDDRMVEAIAGGFPLVVSGHFHETQGRVLNGTLFLRIGTTGGNGAGVLRGFDVPFSAEVLYFSRTPEVGLVAYDVIEQYPETGSLTVTRHLVSQDFGELILTPTMTPSLIPTLTVTPPPSG